MSRNLPLFDAQPEHHTAPAIQSLAEGAFLLGGFAQPHAHQIMADLTRIIEAAPLRHMITPGGFRMSVAMTNCGVAGWVSDRKGYRYATHDPDTSRAWPPMPPTFRELATAAAAQSGFQDFHPDACLINRYQPGARMTLHQDKNEHDFSAPIVSVSLGLPAVFLFGGPERKDKAQRVPLQSGDVVVWGGPSRLFFHGINPLKDGDHPLTGRCRYNLTFRVALG
jgi:alkylated DNA repair protein (DNA oxidative demethylase)